jgi:hypothetical protein
MRTKMDFYCFDITKSYFDNHKKSNVWGKTRSTLKKGTYVILLFALLSCRKAFSFLLINYFLRCLIFFCQHNSLFLQKYLRRPKNGYNTIPPFYQYLFLGIVLSLICCSFRRFTQTALTSRYWTLCLITP